MFRHVRCGASLSLFWRPGNVKGGPEENVPGLREVITEEKKAEGWGSSSQAPEDSGELDFSNEAVPLDWAALH